MQCPNCQTENPERAKFCLECGGALAGLAGAGASASAGGVAASQGAAAVGGDVLGDVLVNSLKIVVGDLDPAEARLWLETYLRAVARDCARLRLRAISPGDTRADREPLDLTDVYVDLNLDFQVPADCATLADYFLREARGQTKESAPGEQAPKPPRLVSALEALAHHRELTLLGKPGSGKSTLASYVALHLAQAGLSRAEASAALGPGWAYGPLLPVRVVLRQFAAGLPDTAQPGRAADLWDFIKAEFKRSGLPEQAGRLIERLARQSGALFLFDGLDEAGDAARRARVLEAVDDFKGTAGEKCRFLLTARPYAWPANLSAKAGVYRLADLGDDQIEAFIRRWYEAMVRAEWESANEAAEKQRALARAAQLPYLLPLARNPLLLTLMAALHTNRGRLPDDRADLYDEMVKLLLEHWNRASGADRALLETLAVPGLTLDHLRSVIQDLAFEMHRGHAGREGPADIDEDWLRRAFRRVLQDSGDKAERVIAYIEDRAGLLIGQGVRDGARQFTFPHRTFQEYLAACHLAGRPDFTEQAVELANTDPAHWREVLVLAARQAKAGRGIPVADALVHGRSHADHGRRQMATDRAWARAILAGEQLLEIGLAAVQASDAHSAVQERVVSWLVEALNQAALPAQERARAGRVLGKLGDPRPEVMTVDGMLFCLVPAGPFYMGSDKGEDPEAEPAELPLHVVELPRFFIGRSPVTQAQFDEFVQAGGYTAERYWGEARAAGRWKDDQVRRQSVDFSKGEVKIIDEWARKPRSFGEPWDLGNHPVVGISWYEALAFTRWLTEHWRAQGWLPAGWEVRLPSEAEWEKAARGGQQVPAEIPLPRPAAMLTAESSPRLRDNPEPRRRYPWSGGFSPECANTGETEIRSTSTPGCFIPGQSPYAIQDLSGNVWEWTRSLWGKQLDKPLKYPYDPLDSWRENLEAEADVMRVLRGGSFHHNRGGARCAYRLGSYPDFGSVNIGFRCVVSPSRRGGAPRP